MGAILEIRFIALFEVDILRVVDVVVLPAHALKAPIQAR
jgi:hypothetical protein